METVWLGQEACGDRSLCGGKAAMLSRLSFHIAVPPGFVVTPVDWKRRGPPAALPEAVAIRFAYGQLGEMCGGSPVYVAVRASPVHEDPAPATASFRGCLGISGAGAVISAAARILKQPGRAVMVQQMISADVCAVAYSVDPARRCEDVLVDAVWGLGSSLAAGTATPDRYRVRRPELSIVSREIALKPLMTVPVPGGTRAVPVPRLLAVQPALDDGQVLLAARLALEAESVSRSPVRIEVAIQDGRPYLIGCQPLDSKP